MLGAAQLQLQHLVYYHSLACLSHVLSCNGITGIPIGTKTSTSKQANCFFFFGLKQKFQCESSVAGVLSGH